MIKANVLHHQQSKRGLKDLTMEKQFAHSWEISSKFLWQMTLWLRDHSGANDAWEDHSQIKQIISQQELPTLYLYL